MNDTISPDTDDTEEQPTKVQEARLWIDDGWTARIIKNQDDDGWAVEMTLDGESEPSLVGPWTMGRDKKNPKPLDSNAFITLVKTAREVLRRHEQQLHAMLHKSLKIGSDKGPLTIKLDIVPDEDDPYGTLSAFNEAGDLLGEARVVPSFKLSPRSASEWVENDFRKPS